MVKAASTAVVIMGFVITGTLAESDGSLQPKQHFKIERPADIQSADANVIYNSIIKQMAEGYAQSGDPSAKNFRKWRRDNHAPYLSGGHGNRFLNNYGNAISKNYLKLSIGQKMPVGSILAKDSFTVTDENEIFAGALFLMEKLATGAKAETGDWRYAMIMPDGSVFGDSAVTGDKSMKFCHDCHKRAKKRDYLYLIPTSYRAVK